MRWLAGILLALRGRARRRAAERERLLRSQEAMARAEELNAEAQAATAAGERERLPGLSVELEHTHEQVRRRRAEPPPTTERHVGAAPGATAIVLLSLGLTMLAAVAFVVLYAAYPDTQLLGLSAGLAATGLAVAAIVAGKRLVPQEKVATEYHFFGDEESVLDADEIVAEAGEGISRRGLLLGAAGAAGVTVAGAAAVPLASIGPRVDGRHATTDWTRGRRVVDDTGRPIRLADVQAGAMRLGFPEGGDPRRKLDAINLLRIDPRELDLPADRKAKCPQGVVAYSRICTHAGCAVSMYRVPLFGDTEPSPALVCPCHYSTFDPRRGCAVDFGPAGRPLPQLPLRVNAAGELEADGGFYDPPGPSYGTVRLEHGQDA